MIPYPNIDPAFLRIGTLELRWYGLMYALAFVIGYFLLVHMLRRTKRFQKMKLAEIELFDLLFYVLLGVIIGGRIGYVLFYNLPQYLSNPLSIFMIWEGGMSFHGGLLGVVVMGLWYCRRNNISIWDLGDLLVIPSALGLGLGRIGNFINAELYGRVTDVSWCMQFPTAIGCRHPSQLYEFFLEGIVLFAILWFLKDRKFAKGTVLWAFVGLYGIFRFGVEFTREPDTQLGYLLGGLTMGQLLCIPMILLAIWGLWYVNRLPPTKS